MSLTPPRPATPTVLGPPDPVPVLVDPAAGVELRALRSGDLPALVECCRDRESVRWTTLPDPPGGYTLADGQAFLDVVRQGWVEGDRMTWALQAERDGRPVYSGGVSLRLAGDGSAEVGYLLHPAARGRGLMTAALRLLRDHSFDRLGLEVLRWRAVTGNWPSRRVAAAVGFRVDGTVRRFLPQRGSLLDGWVATMTRDDPREPLPWRDPPRLAGAGISLRPFAERDLDRIVTACRDPRTRHWLVSLPQPYARGDAAAFVESTRELSASGGGLVWCVADATTDDCLASVGLEGLGGYSRRAEIGYWAHPEARGRGVVVEAVRVVTGWAEGSGLTDSLLVRCAAGNTASRHVAGHAGFREVGTLPGAEPVGDGTLSDLVLYARP
ncbi:MAG: hypothetical protein JWP61_1121 [Friedmanniella sp.]|nr:hypothetical protein [Friedmanniella sp.]